MLFTSPLVVTVGLGLTIPLSLVGQMILASQYSSAAYWIGAGIVLISFIFINHESTQAEQQASGDVRVESLPLSSSSSLSSSATALGSEEGLGLGLGLGEQQPGRERQGGSSGEREIEEGRGREREGLVEVSPVGDRSNPR